MKATRRRRLYRVRNAARRFVQAVDALRDTDLGWVRVSPLSVDAAAYAAKKLEAALSRILDDDFADGGGA